MADRLTSMPESLQLRILSSLDTRHAVQTSTLSKSWVSAWTWIPNLYFSSYGFKSFAVFNEFITKALSLRHSVKLEKLTIKGNAMCNDKILKKVFDYAFLHGVEELEAVIKDVVVRTWPIWLHTSSDSLKSLKLGSTYHMGCHFLGPRSGSFKNLTNLDLEMVTITDLDPFTGFPALEKLKLVDCHVGTEGNVLKVHSLQLSELTMLYNHDVNSLELTTPNLRCFVYRAFHFPQLTMHQGGLPFLDTVVLDYGDLFSRKQQRRMAFDDLLTLFNSLENAKSLTIFTPAFQVLASCPGELVNRCSPFQRLKCLKLDFNMYFRSRLGKSSEFVPVVKAYLKQ